ncbi:MAG: hypothetical protein DMG13_29680 [Acidobacteria bacterium]|nr:MAG: hypothetical protein DMG13_29680 [Acidobacteriota bacterium]
MAISNLRIRELTSFNASPRGASAAAESIELHQNNRVVAGHLETFLALSHECSSHLIAMIDPIECMSPAETWRSDQEVRREVFQRTYRLGRSSCKPCLVW